VKIIHTADWHLCDRLGKIDRTADLESQVQRVADLCMERDADVLLIAGDLFSKDASVDNMTVALNHMRTIFAPFFQRGGTVLAITGNHDRDGRINMVRAGMTLASPVAGQDGNLRGGRMYLINGRTIATLAGADGQRVQFVLVPYPFACRYDLPATEYRTREEENQLLHARVANWLQGLSTDARFDATLPTVLAAHLHVRGSEVHTLYQMTEREDVLFDFADLNPGWAYIALGHIHKAQCLGGMAHVRYPGSLDRLAFDEMGNDAGVLSVEINRCGLAGDPEWLPLPPTPFHAIALNDPEVELPKLAEHPDRATGIIKVAVTQVPDGLSRDEIGRQLRRLIPRLHELKWPETKSAEPIHKVDPREGCAKTVRMYLAERLEKDPDKEAVLALAEEFLREEVET
jgi:exonuclease SbcD